MPADPTQIQAVYLLVARQTDPAARAAVLDRECGPNVELRQAVKALLRPTVAPDVLAAEEATLVRGRPKGAPAPRGTPASGRLFAGRYLLAQKIGEGGMGEVWFAEQAEPVRRQVAVKLVKAGAASPGLLAPTPTRG